MLGISRKLRITLLSLASLTFLTLSASQSLAADATNWVAFNDHASGVNTAADVTTYTISTTVGAGGPLTDFLTGGAITPNQVGVEIIPAGTINGTTGSSAAPRAGTPADQIWGGLIDWDASALYFAPPADYTASVTFTFTNLDAGKRYVFRGTSVRGNNYATRWAMATIAGIEHAVPAHILGTGTPGVDSSPGIITNGWAPYGNTMIPGRQAGWNAGENRCGDVIGWDEIIPSGTSFSVICSNMYVISPTVPTVAGGETTLNNYCYAFGAIMLAELGEPAPLGITAEPAAETLVEEYSALNISITVTGSAPRYQWYQEVDSEYAPIPGATFSTYSKASARLSDAGNYYVVATNELNSVTSTVAQVTVFVDPIEITEEPQNVGVVLLRPFSLSVTATGTNPQYQWYREDTGVLTPIDGATSSAYAVESAAFSDDGNYVVVVSNSLYSVTSEIAVVSVTEDSVAPTVVRVVPSATLDRITIEFSERMDNDSATDVFNYDSTGFFFEDAYLTNDGYAVVLTTTAQTPNSLASVTVSWFDSIYDLSTANVLAETNIEFQTWSLNLMGGMLFEKFDIGAGNDVTNLTDHPNFPDSPDSAYGIPEFNPTNAFTLAEGDASRDGYGGRVRGWFMPPFSGDWRLFLSSDDNSELWFNPIGSDAAGKVLVAFGTNCCEAFNEPPSEKTSAPYALIAGEAYYVEALYKEGTGGDYFVAAARLEGQPDTAASLGWMGGNGIGYPAIPPGLAGTLSFDTQPASTSVETPNPASFSAAASSSTDAPILYQWQRDDLLGSFTNVPGANTKTLSLSQTDIAVDNNAQFRSVITSADVQLISDVAVLTVTPDMTGPGLMSVVPDLTLSSLTVSFSEELDAVAANTAGNYVLCDAYDAANCILVNTATLDANGTQVVLATAAPVSGAVYRLTVLNLTDLAGNPVQDPNSIIVGAVATFQQGDANGYTGTQDTLVEGDAPAANHGADESINVDDAGPLANGLIRFDNIFGGAGTQIPLGSTINSATLTVTTFDPGGLVNLYRMLQTWDQSTATWTSMGNGIQTDDVQASSTVVAAVDSDNGVTTLDITTTVQEWSAGAPNYGWALIHQASGSDGGWDFRSSEYAATPTERPLLTVVYTPSGATNPVTIVSQPAPETTINETESVTLTVGVSGTKPRFQWYKEGVGAIVGEDGPSLTLTDTDETDSGTYYCIITNFLPSSVQSDNAVVTVVPDTNGPALLSALGTDDTTVVMSFSEALDATSVGILGNYTLAPALGGAALTIVSAELDPSGTMVTLTTSPRAAWTHYQLTVQDVTDAAYRLNPLAPNPSSLFLPYQITLKTADSGWKYNDLGVDLGTEWTGTAYDDTAWADGTALLWIQRFNAAINTNVSDVLPGTQMAWTNDLGNTNITYYLRTTFTMPVVDEGVTYALQVTPIIDDGAAFYINGSDAGRVGTPEGPLTWDTLASRSQGSEYRFEGPYDLAVDNVVFGGENVLAVEVHQTSLTSSDLAFAADLTLYVPALEMRVLTSVDAEGGITLTWPPVPGYSLYESDNVEGEYTAVAGDPDGSYTIPVPLAAKKFYRLEQP